MCDLDRFFSKVLAQGVCWEWTGASNGRYGFFRYRGKNEMAHRAVWMILVGEIPLGYVMDHLCKNQMCVNPDHLEPVSQKTNVRRGALMHVARLPRKAAA